MIPGKLLAKCVCVFLFVCFCPRILVSQTATVTFYTPYRTSMQQFRDEEAWGKRRPDFGRVFDNGAGLARLGPNRIVSFQLPVGAHNFSARFKAKPQDHHSDSLTLDLSASEHYYLRLTVTGKPWNPYVLSGPHLENVDCSVALKEFGKSKPLEQKYVEKNALSALRTDGPDITCP